MTKQFNISEARANLPELIDGLEQGLETEIIITRHGKPVAKLNPYIFLQKEYSLRGLPFSMSDDFNEPMEDLWETVANS